MATSDSDDFESADEELAVRNTPSRKVSSQWQNTNSVIDSESDDDNECMQQAGKSSGWNSGNRSVQTSGQDRRSRTSVSSIESTSSKSSSTKTAAKEEAKVTSKDTAVKSTVEFQNKASQDAYKFNKNPAKVTECNKELKDLSVAAGTKSVAKEEAKVTPTDTAVEFQNKASQDAKKAIKNPAKVKECTEELKELSIAAEISESETAAAISSEANKSEAAKKIASEADKSEAAKKIASSEASDTSNKKKEEEQSEEKSKSDVPAGKKERQQRQRKPKESKSLGAKKLGAKVEAAAKPPPMEARTPDEIRRQAIAEGKEPPIIEECWEFNEEETAKILKGMKDFGLGDGNKVKMPEELKSDKKFKEIFKPDGWEDLDDEEILAELDDKRVLPVLDKLAAASEEPSNSGWGWGSWGVSSFINSATAGVTTLTSHVTHGLELLDQAVGAPHPEELAKTEEKSEDSNEEKSSSSPEAQPQLSFGFNDLISGVSSITKLVESTGSKVITGGLGTLETIGKKTMEVLQEGDPGLKKKRAFFLNENDKPILSQMLREAKEQADVEEKTLEEKQLTRKVHFESLFDDFQGLVHLEALEMLSKQCNIKIQQRLVTLDTDELNSIQETLEEVKELCDLGDEDEEEESEENLQERLKSACKDLGVAITYEKLQDIWKDTRTYMTEVSTPESTATEREVFQRAISTLARFTAFSVERFHKTAELLLIKERRSTVNEADALVQLTRILSGQIGIAANLFSNWLNECKKNAEKPDTKVDITTIFLEAANASSYIQDAFRLLIPILQVGAI